MHYDRYDERDDEFGGIGDFFKGVGRGFRDAGKWVGGAVQTAGKGIKAAVGKIGEIPVVGPLLSAGFTLGGANLFITAGEIASGKRLDKAALNHLSREVKSVKAVAPYAQMVLSFVPGVGQGISAGIGAGLALAEGQPITDALVAGVKGAIPGGPLAQAAFDVGMAAIEGKSFDQVAINALPLPDQFKKGINTSIRIAKDLSKGKKVSDALLDEAIRYLPPEGKTAVRVARRAASGEELSAIVFDESLKQLPPDAREALTIGIAVSEGKVLQVAQMAALNDSRWKNNLTKAGRHRARRNGVVGAAASLSYQSTQRLGRRAPSPSIPSGRRGGGGGSRGRPPSKAKPKPKAKPKKESYASIMKRAKAAGRAAGYKAGHRETYASRLKRAKAAGRAATAEKAKKRRPPTLRKGLSPARKAKIKKAAKESQRGFLLATGLLTHRITQAQMLAVRAQMKGAAKRGFDMGVSTHIGLKLNKAPQLLTAKEKAGYYIARGMSGARPAQKVGMMKATITDPEARRGAEVAVDQYLQERKPWYKKFWSFVTGG